MTVSTGIIYEQPLNERVRTLLRLSHLFRLTDHYLGGMTEWDIRSALDTLLNITDLIGRTDLRSDMIKELEKLAQGFRALQRNPGVDPARLERLLNEIAENLEDLRDRYTQPGQLMRQDELVAAVRQRNAILGGTCNFDLPAYHYWLNRPLSFQREALETWQSDLAGVKNGVYLLLKLIRNSSDPSIETAEKGFFQRSLDPASNCQLIRVILADEAGCFPEISAGKHRFTVRFMDQVDTTRRATQTDADIEFELHCCTL